MRRTEVGNEERALIDWIEIEQRLRKIEDTLVTVQTVVYLLSDLLGRAIPAMEDGAVGQEAVEPQCAQGVKGERMKKMELGLPSVFWLVLILALIPGVQMVLKQFFPATEYWYSALIVAILGAVAKAIQVTYGDDLPTPVAGPPEAAAAPIGEMTARPGKLRRWLI